MQEVVRHGNDYPDHLNPAGLQDDTQLSEQLSLLLCVVSDQAGWIAVLSLPGGL